MDLAVLGPLQVRLDGAVVEVPGTKERTLLARLAAAAGRTVPTDDLVQALWGDSPPRSAAKSLQTFVLRLRNILEPDRHGPPRVLLTEPSGYRLAVPADAVDAHRFVRLVEQGRRALDEGRTKEAGRLLDEALALWRGPAFAGCEGTGFGDREAARLDELRLLALEDRSAAAVRGSGSAAAVPELERLLDEHPYRERAWGLLVLALYRSGRQSDALAAYDRVRSLLADQLGVDPGPALRTLHAQVLAQDPALLSASEPVETPAVPDTLRTAAGPAAAVDGAAPVLEEPLARALAELRAALLGGAAEVLLAGLPGSGRHRVALALADEVVATGHHVVHVTGGVTGSGRPARVAGPPSSERAGLVVVEPGGGHVQPGARGTSPVPLLRLVDGDAPKGHSHVVRVGTLSSEDVRRVLLAAGTAALPPSHDALEDAVRLALRETGGRADAVRGWALAWARRAAGERVEHAAGRARSSTGRLHADREELRDGVEALRTAAALTTPAVAGVCPWPGLLAYDVEDADRYAGRERLVAECVARLAAPGVLGVVGASGSGKSSLVRAGLVAALSEGALPGSEGWARVLLRPGAHPMTALTRAALGAASRPVDVDDLVGRLLDGGGGTRTLLVVDQAEELWTACSDPGERAAFLDAVTDLAVTGRTGEGRPAVSVVLVVRADYVAELTARPELAAAVADCTVLVGPPTPQEVRRAVELPAARAGLVLDTGLVDALVEDAGQEPGVLPLLSTALQGLWQSRSGPRLTLSAYVAAGALSGAVARLAEGAWQRLDEAQQDTARVVLARLAGPGEAGVVTRRRVRMEELRALGRPDVDHVVGELVEARLCTRGNGSVEVAHEALFREWPRLRGWLAEDAGAQRLLRRLTVAAAEWDADGRDRAAVWRGARLQAAVDAVAENPDLVTDVERAFVTAGTEAVDAQRRDAEQRAADAQRSNRRLRSLLGGVGALLVVALVAGGVAVVSAQRAAEARVAADAKRLAAVAVNEEYLDRALLSAVEAVRTEQAPETYGALLTLLARVPALVTTVRTPDRFLAAGRSADGDTVYLGENVARLRAVDATDGTERWTVQTLSQPGNPTATPDGSTVVVQDGGEENVLRGLDAGTGEELWRMESEDLGEQWLGPELAWLPGGELVAGGWDDLLLIDVERQVVQRRIPWPEGSEVGLLASLGDGRLLVEASGPPPEDGGDVAGNPWHLVDTDTGAVSPTALRGRVLDVSDDGERLLLAQDAVGGASDLTVVGTDDLAPAAPVVRVPGAADAAAFSPDGRLLAVATDDLVTLHDGATGAPGERSFQGHSGKVMEMQFDAGGMRLWTAGRDGAAMLWDLGAGAGLLSVTDSEVPGYRAAVADDGSVAVVNRWHDLRFNEARLLDPGTGEDLLGRELPVPDGCVCQVWAVAVTPDGRTALGGLQVWEGTTEAPERTGPDAPGRLVSWDTTDGTIGWVVDLPWHPQGVDVAPDGRTAVVNGGTGWAVVDLVSATVVAEHEHEQVVDTPVTGTAVISPDGSRAALLRGPSALVVGLPGGEVLHEEVVQEEEMLWTVAWTPDGATLLTGGFSGAVHVLDAGSLQPRVPPRLVNAGWVMALAVTPDGLAASLGSDGDLLLWDTRTWQPMGAPVVQGPGWGWLRLTPDGSTLEAAYEDGTVMSVPTERDEWIRIACRVAGRDLTAAEWEAARPASPWRSTCGSTAT